MHNCRNSHQMIAYIIQHRSHRISHFKLVHALRNDNSAGFNRIYLRDKFNSPLFSQVDRRFHGSVYMHRSILPSQVLCLDIIT